MNESVINALSLIKSSKNRTRIIHAINDSVFTPSEISKKTDIRLNHVSMHLNEMKKSGIVECLNESTKKGRLYKLTDVGQQVVDILKNG